MLTDRKLSWFPLNGPFYAPGNKRLLMMHKSLGHAQLNGSKIYQAHLSPLHLAKKPFQTQRATMYIYIATWIERTTWSRIFDNKFRVCESRMEWDRRGCNNALLASCTEVTMIFPAIHLLPCKCLYQGNGHHIEVLSTVTKLQMLKPIMVNG